MWWIVLIGVLYLLCGIPVGLTILFLGASITDEPIFKVMLSCVAGALLWPVLLFSLFFVNLPQGES